MACTFGKFFVCFSVCLVFTMLYVYFKRCHSVRVAYMRACIDQGR